MIKGGAREWFDARILRALGRVKIAARRPLTGNHRANRTARRTGASVEFAEHRTYVPGDDPRLLDWTAYGRLDRLYTRLFHDEEDMHVCLLLDVSQSMRTAWSASIDKFAMAKRLTAMLSHVALDSHLQVSLGFFADALIRFSEPMRGKIRFHDILTLLDSAPVGRGTTCFAASLDAVAASSPRRSLFVVVSDFFDPGGIENPLKKLLHRRCDLVLIDVYEEFNPPSVADGDLVLVDSETGAETVVDASPMAMAELSQQIARHNESIQRWASQSGIPFARVRAAGSDDEAVRALISAGVLRQ